MPPAWAASRASAISMPSERMVSKLHRAVADQVLEGGAVEELHDEEGAVAFLADVVDRADVGMIQRGRGLGFAAKTFEGLAVLGQIFGKKLEGDEAAEARVFGFVDHAHAAATELFDDPVVRDGLIEQVRVAPPQGSSHAKARRGGSQRACRPSCLFDRCASMAHRERNTSACYQRGLRRSTASGYNQVSDVDGLRCCATNPIRFCQFASCSFTRAECWLHCLVCPRRYRANLPSRLRPSLFGSD